MKQYVAVMMMVLLTGCSLAPDAVIPTDRVPESWQNAAGEKTAKPALWSDFGSAELNQLITAALANNTDLSAALARIEQARAGTRIAGSGLYPQVDASGSAAKDRNRIDGRTSRNETLQAGIDISYELDLWQRNSNLYDSAFWGLRASEYDKNALSILVASEVARLYSGVLAFDARLDVATKNLKNAQDVLRVTEARYEAGSISGLERAQQRTSVSNTEAAIASLKNQRDLFFNQLAQVTGVAPAGLKLAGNETLDQLKTNDVPLTTPWELLSRRPDIAAAEARLRAANIDIGIARANALPSLSLALSGGVVGNPSGTLAGLAASFFAPIFHGGALEGEIERSEAVRNEQIAGYQSVLLTSFREVEDALSNADAANTRRTSLSVAADEARKADAIARARFDAGSIDFTTLLTTQAALLQAEDSYLGAVQEQLAAHIDLIRALGGGF